ncbi:MAG: rRNA pseudouridine synthase [Clostridiales bacterium]|nr:rRNA pseudouridine synthase [Clostridiales bacterium]MDY4654666.1 pseudouridine synthase [Eubacteriales bacterium]
MRINKYIASCGICSRRAAEELILDGKVKVNGKVVKELATEIDEYNDTVTLDGRKITLVSRYIYIMFNKPKGCVCTVKDDKGRKTIMDYLESFSDKRIFPIGRLDYDTEGLLLLTNDGDLANRLTQPISEVPKTYIAKVEGEIAESDLARLRNGIVLDGVKLRRCKIKLLGTEDNVSRYEVTIFEGKNRQIHRMFESIGKEVVFLKRIKIGDVKLGGLGRGANRYLTEKELASLNRL